MPKVTRKNTAISSEFTVCKFPRESSGALRHSEILLHDIWKRYEKDDHCGNCETPASKLVDGILGWEAVDFEDLKVQIRVLDDIKEYMPWLFEDDESVKGLSKHERDIESNALFLIRWGILGIHQSGRIGSFGHEYRIKGLDVPPQSEVEGQQKAKLAEIRARGIAELAAKNAA